MEEETPLMLNTNSQNKLKSKEISGLDNVAFDIDLTEVTTRKEYWEDEFDEDKFIFSDDKKRGTSLIWNDFIILIVEYLQWLALIQSLSLRWPWPEAWIKSMGWIFATNLDVWEIAKVNSNSTYKSVQEHFTDSKLMPFEYWHVLVAWGILLLILTLLYGVAYCVLVHMDHPYLMVRIAHIQKAFIIVMQVLALPLGVALGKSFHCTEEVSHNGNIMYVDRNQSCLSDVQWSYMAVGIFVAGLFYIVYPIWLIKKTKLELIFNNSPGHEAHLQLKETEYVQGLDVVYIVSAFHIFSSFKLRSAHYRGAMHILKFFGVIVYATMFYYTYYQVLALTCLMFVYLVAFAILRPFRVKIFNGFLCISLCCLVLNLLTGTLRSSFDVYSLRSVWFTPSYTAWTLFAINGVWLFVALLMFIYLVLHQLSVFKRPLWPSLTSEGVEKLDEQTKKYMRSVLVARHVVERAMSVHPLFAPAHELSRQIQIINAYCREAEFLGDPLQDTLWHLLDELIEVHSQIAPRSLFADSVKDSIRTTANDLMRILPQFIKRLAQREYDFLLVSPVKRRLLLKMYCMGLFLNGRAEKLKTKEVNKQALDRVWTREKSQKKSLNYLRTLQPDSEIGPRVNQRDESRSQDSLSFLSDDSVSIDVDYMVAGIRSKSSSRSQSKHINSFRPDERVTSSTPQGYSNSSSSGKSSAVRPASRHSVLSEDNQTELPGSIEDVSRPSVHIEGFEVEAVLENSRDTPTRLSQSDEKSGDNSNIEV